MAPYFLKPIDLQSTSVQKLPAISARNHRGSRKLLSSQELPETQMERELTLIKTIFYDSESD